MFKLSKTDPNGGRLGELERGSKQIITPSFFMTSNFGGGAGDVYRIVTYIDLLEKLNIPILYNYYYLLGRGTFSVKYVKEIPQFKNINDFILHIRQKFIEMGNSISGHSITKPKWNPITLLDSGSGNFLRDEIKQTESPKELIANFNKIISDFIDFCNLHEIDIMMAMDIAGKYTHKQGEKGDQKYKKIFNILSSDLGINFKLLSDTLDIIKTKQKNFLIYAPLHGNTPEEYRMFTKTILDLEKKKGQKFDGFGVGGLANYKEKENSEWNVPDSSNSSIKAGVVVGRAVKTIRNELTKNGDNRPIHALGVGSENLIIPLVYAGADTFDAHSSWRRATDGSRENAEHVDDSNKKGSFSKYLVPMLHKNGEIIKENQENVLDYIRLNKLDETIVCSCNVCEKYSIAKIKELYSKDGEEFHFAKILCYVHAIAQHQIICQRLQKDIQNGDGVRKLINEIVDPNLKSDLESIIKAI